ncbi:hypothetical protein [Actinacidiphila acididurans]|uniref:DUF2332 domain-containing protein n=1 Tax=Actinacidiphila acididurans TaxID=2784346 RepID=A0ABS2TNU6_9ACTN|nr:hypothetical protein [Actinacidiphila acididurans]MBM9504502.1 hypothetical protein [Actinacidiphila acididurans]
MTTDHADSLLETLTDMQRHEQGNHGWSVVHEALALLMRSGDPALDALLAAVRASRPGISDSHLITLLGIALRGLADRDPEAAGLFRPEPAAAGRAAALASILGRDGAQIAAVVTEHSNSFTAARRFLVPQVLLGAYAAHHGIAEVRLADLGTSIGLLPRQLNNRAVFERFAPDLRWSPEAPPYRPIPLTARYGVDAPPLPDLDWVRHCHGPSAYYGDRFSEVLWTLEQTTPDPPGLRLEALDLLDADALTGYLRERRINVATCNFVLYQYDPATRERIVAAVLRGLAAPGLLLSMEPGHELRRQGARVTAYLDGDTTGRPVADVSDAHCIGTVTLLPASADLTGAVRKPR